VDDDGASNSQNVIQELENKFKVDLDNLPEDDLMAHFKKDKSSFLPDGDDVDVDDIDVDLKNKVMNMKLPNQNMAERPSDFSLPDFLDDKEEQFALMKNEEKQIEDDQE
jgi:hypothetical protein